jgi:16S rRNA processing protein RimM
MGGKIDDMIKESEVYKIGTITRTHGVRGELSLSFTDDVWDRVDADYLVLRIDGILVPFFMEEYRFRSDTMALVKFQDYDSAEAAKELCGCDVCFPLALTQEPEEDGEYTWRYFTGFLVVDKQAGELGKIAYVDDSTQNVLFHVGERLIPAVESFVTCVDHQKRIITMQLPEGLLDL